ncbi:LOW QUALITY PROTEIN: cytochrome P450 3A29-like [Leptosomus discolor]
MDLLPNFSFVTWLLLIVFLSLLVLYGIWSFQAFKKLCIPGPQPLPFLGTFLGYWHGVLNFDQMCFEKYGKIGGIFDGRQPMLAVSDSILIKYILVKECCSIFTDRRNFRLNGILESALIVAEDEEWKRIRTVLSPAFTSGKLKEVKQMPLALCINSWRRTGPFLRATFTPSWSGCLAGIGAACGFWEENGVTIPKGMVVMIPAYVLGHDPEYWPEPEEFRPENKESKESIDPYTFPVGTGPRNCIGTRFALLTVKVAAVVLLQNFSFRTCKDTPIPLVLDTKDFTQPKQPIILKMVPRAHPGLEKHLHLLAPHADEAGDRQRRGARREIDRRTHGTAVSPGTYGEFCCGQQPAHRIKELVAQPQHLDAAPALLGASTADSISGEGVLRALWNLEQPFNSSRFGPRCCLGPLVVAAVPAVKNAAP